MVHLLVFCAATPLKYPATLAAPPSHMLDHDNLKVKSCNKGLISTL